MYEPMDMYFSDVERSILMHRWNLEKERKLARNLLERCQTRCNLFPNHCIERVNPPFTKVVSRNRRHSLETKSYNPSVAASNLHEMQYRFSEMSNKFSQYYPSQTNTLDFNPSYNNYHCDDLFLDCALPSAAARWRHSENNSSNSDITSEGSFAMQCETNWRSSIGLGRAQSPKRKSKPRKLVETTSSEGLNQLDEDFDSVSSSTGGAEKKGSMSLESIALIVNGNANPRRVIDQLLLLHKRIQRNEKTDDEGIDEFKTNYQPNVKGYEFFLSNLGERNHKFGSLDEVPEKLVPSGRTSREMVHGEMESLISCLKIDTKQSNTNEDIGKIKGEKLINIRCQEVTTCLVGVLMKVKIEVMNMVDQQILIAVNLDRIQGDENSINLDIPKEITTVAPSDCTCITMNIKMLKLCEPTILGLQFGIINMVTRESQNVPHLMCFVSAENVIQMTGPDLNNEMWMGDITEGVINTRPITISNKNTIDVILEAQVIQSLPTVFFATNPDETLKPDSMIDGTLKMVLKSQESATMNIEFRGLNLETLIKSNLGTNDDIYSAGGKVQIRIYESESMTEIEKKEISLTGRIGTVSIKPCEMPSPVILKSGESRPFYVKNHGNVAIILKPIIESSDRSNENKDQDVCKNFVITPESFEISPGEIQCIFIAYNPKVSKGDENVSIKLWTENMEKLVFVHPLIGTTNSAENQNSSTRRCSLPQFSKKFQSAISPDPSNLGRNSLGPQTVLDQIIPIKATHSALNWGSVPAGKRQLKEFKIRNMSNRKLKLTANIEGSDRSFRFLKDGYKLVSTISVSFRDFETKTLYIAFEPQNPGASVGKIIFNRFAYKQGNSENRPSKLIQLSGYCGYAKLELSGAVNDNGQFWLPMDNNNHEFLKSSLKLKNSGDLPSYFKIELQPKVISPDLHSTWQVFPTECILQPKEEKIVHVTFKPKKYDLPVLRESYVGTLKIIHGDEPTRQRLCRLYKKMSKDNRIREENRFCEIFSTLCSSTFSQETPTRDLFMVRDSVQNLTDLCQEINEVEVKLILSRSKDESGSIITDLLDDSVTFHSLLNDTTNESTCYKNR